MLLTECDMLSRVSVSDEVRGYVAELIKGNGMTQNDLASKLKRSQGSVSMLLSGQRRANALDLLEAISKEFGFRLSELIAEAERRDLLRHSGTGQQNTQQGGFVVTPAARVLALEGQLAVYKTVIARVRSVVEEAVDADHRDEGRATPREKPKRGRRR